LRSAHFSNRGSRSFEAAGFDSGSRYGLENGNGRSAATYETSEFRLKLLNLFGDGDGLFEFGECGHIGRVNDGNGGASIAAFTEMPHLHSRISNPISSRCFKAGVRIH
jgi:hypothetical protein